MKPLLLSGLLCLCVNAAWPQCSTTGFVNGTVFTTDNSIGDYNFSSPGNVQSSDNSRSSAASLISILSGDTYYLKVTGFNFSIPSYASVCGITVEIECRATGLLLTAAVRDNQVRLIKGGVITGSNYAKPGDWGSADGYSTYGGATDLWGTTLTPADVNASNFGIAFSASIIALVAALPNAQVDHIRVRVNFNPVLPVRLSYFKAFRKQNKVALEWKTTEEEDNATITLERSLDNKEWSPLQEYALSNFHHNKAYGYEDMLLQNGDYAYRLKTIAASGAVTYSATNFVAVEDVRTVFVYPNPASDFIILRMGSANEPIIITDSYARQWKLPAERMEHTGSRINIQRLPKGIYILRTGQQSLRFVKE